MTAEVAILNKSAVALAADSAVTISAGTREEKIFDNADKLFELCGPAIGIMIYNGMSFAEAPLPSLIRTFRTKYRSFGSVEDAAKEFLSFLNEFGANASRRAQNDALKSMVEYLIEGISDRYREKIIKMLDEPWDENIKTKEDLDRRRESLLNDVIEVYSRILDGRDDALFVGEGEIDFSESTVEFLRSLISKRMSIFANQDQMESILALSKKALQKDILSMHLTGIVVAGFGKKELFPTLISFEIDGVVDARLKYIQTNYIDIDREGPKASVIPFAQKEMVERFLYGLDANIQRNIRQFCKGTVVEIRKLIFDRVQFETDEARAELTSQAERAESAFLEGLDSQAFAEIRSDSRSEIEDMVEFMPKPELATMAEALVNLTSIKRRVSRGMETVGGPIDVAVISQSEGFVWIKRKHYFSADLNPRYMRRVERELLETQNVASAPRRTRASGKAGKPSRSAPK